MTHRDLSDTPRPWIIGYLAGEVATGELMARLDGAADKLTHINYAFGLIGPDGRAVLGQPDADIARAYPGDEGGPDGLRGAFRQLQLLKERHPHLRTLISMGGWTGSGGFSDACATPEGRRELAASIIELFLTRWPGVFDGIDIDWEYPVHGGLPDNGYRPEDRRNCTMLFVELRRQLDELGESTGRRYLLTAAVPAGKALPVSTFELREIAAILDVVNVMTYDISGSAESGNTNFNAALCPSSTDPRTFGDHRFQNVEGTVEAFLEAGVPREKLVVGMPFYGRGFTGVPPENDGLYQPFTEMISARYHQIATEYLPAFERHWHAEAGVPWLYDAGTGTMLSYDDPESIGRKADFIRERGLGGAMFWELSGDDASWSLLSAIADRLR
jgi:chitinase